MLLHIVSPSPFQYDALQRCLAIATAEDGLLLIEDATLALLNPAQHLGASPGCRLFALAADLKARGISLPIGLEITVVDYDGFVLLTIQHDKTLSWF